MQMVKTNHMNITVSSTAFISVNITLKKGAELGRFLLGSTVICVFPNNRVNIDKNLSKGTTVKMGEPLGSIKSGK